VGRHFLVCSLFENCIYLLAVKPWNLDLPNRLAELEPKLLEETELRHKAFLAQTNTLHGGN
jgi:hypothetical protein